MTVRFSEPFWCYFGLLGISGGAGDLTGPCSCCLSGQKGFPQAGCRMSLHGGGVRGSQGEIILSLATYGWCVST